MTGLTQDQKQSLIRVEMSTGAVEEFNRALQTLQLSEKVSRETLAADSLKAESIYRKGGELLSSLPPKGRRDARQAEAADLVKGNLRQARNAFAKAYVETIYRQLTRNFSRPLRDIELIYEVAGLCPGLCPARKEVAAELELPLAEKEGCEVAQGDFFSHLLDHPGTGTHMINVMLQPVPQARHLLEKFRRDGRLDLGPVQVERQGAMGCVFFNNLDYLNAEDDSTLLPFETAVDLVLLDPDIQVGLLRGNPVQHPKHRGRRVFSAGLNLTHLYQGKLSLMFYLTRDLAVVNKLYRGLNLASVQGGGPESTLEKSWIAALEAFAIGGGCQLLLVVDYVVAERGAYFNLPARKEGIIPGAAPLRLARFVGERAAQAGVLFDRTFPVDSPEGRLLVNEVVEPAAMDAAIERMARDAAGSGAVSTGANRKALRLAHEPLDLFRQYMALYCREQADCHFSPTLVSNLERYWANRQRPPLG